MLNVLAAVEAYLTALLEIRDTRSQPETSFYPALRDLLNDVAKASGLKQFCVMQMSNQGAGFPDGGIFGSSQHRRRDETAPLLGVSPEHGVIEAKPVEDDAWLTADTQQVSRYLTHYHQVLVTNFRDFLLLGEDGKGQPANLGSFQFAESATAFWQQAQHPRKLAQDKGQQFAEFLFRVMLSRARLKDPSDVARLLASFARDARLLVEHKDAPGLVPLRSALEEALGLKFEGEKGDHFFRATLVQTLFYGIFSAWVLWHQESPGRSDEFDWKEAAYYLRLPMLAALFEQVSMPSKLRELGLVEVLDGAGAALNRVVRADFYSKFDEGHAVLYFYEPFLKAYDPDLRKALGVWFTPPEIVKYMVARVDHVLRTELGIEDGLADERVYVLDPACGTGAYLVEVADRIAKNLRPNKSALQVAAEVKRALVKRIFGFEILPAPFVVSHLQLGLALKRHGATFGPKERARVYLTNALTGWESPNGVARDNPRQLWLNYPALAEERDAAFEVKREEPILVVIGNPPYNAFAGVSPKDERGMVDVGKYKEGLVEEWGIKKFNLDDLYVRFFRLAERRILEGNNEGKPGRGVVCYISNHSWVSDPSFVVLRKRLLAGFDKFWVENMHGDRKISEYAPDGRTSETVFAIPGLSAGIRQGVAISLWVKKDRSASGDAEVRFRDDINDAKATERRAHLLAALEETDHESRYAVARPDSTNRYAFRPAATSAVYDRWPKAVDLAKSYHNGPYDARNGALYSVDRQTLVKRISAYYDSDVTDDVVRRLQPDLMTAKSGYNPTTVRAYLIRNSAFAPSSIWRMQFKPFDTRWYYCELKSSLCCRPSPDLMQHMFVGNRVFVTRSHGVAQPEGFPIYYGSTLMERDEMRGHARLFPVRLQSTATRHTSEGQGAILKPAPVANLSSTARNYLGRLGVGACDTDQQSASLVWFHALAVGYSQTYLTENEAGVRQDWPRIPLPDKRELLEASAALGREVAALLDTEGEVRGVTTGRIRPELAAMARPSKDGGESLDPDKDFAVAANWGHAGKGGVTMPGKGDVRERDYWPDEKQAIEEAAMRLGLSQKEVFARLGKTTLDIYLNDAAFWKNVPKGVWEFYIGGYQVVKKWLSYREEKLLGRPLKYEEVEHVMNTCRRLATILLLGPKLDTNYKVIKGSLYRWPGKPDRG